MERKLFWVLLAASLLFFSYMQWGGILTGEGQDQQPLPTLNAEKIRLLEKTSIGQASAVPPSPVIVQSAVQAAPPVAQSAVPAPATKTCLEWGEFSGKELARAHAALSALRLGDVLAQRQVERDNAYWVFIPPPKNHAELSRKIAQLKARGVDDYFVDQKAGKWHNAISLGVFRTEEAAQKFLDTIKAKGVSSAKVGERASKIVLTIFMLKDLDARMAEKMAEMQKDFSGSEQKTVACSN